MNLFEAIQALQSSLEEFKKVAHEMLPEYQDDEVESWANFPHQQWTQVHSLSQTTPGRGQKTSISVQAVDDTLPSTEYFLTKPMTATASERRRSTSIHIAPPQVYLHTKPGNN